MDRNIKIADSMLDLVGEIPLVRLNRIDVEEGAEILVKPEYLNPSGSIKDRPAKWMVEAAESQGLLREGSTIVEATTGNMGTSLAFVAAVKGYKIAAYAPASVADEIKAGIMQAYGCEVRKVDLEAYEAQIPARGGGAAPLDESVHGSFVELLPRQICLDAEQASADVWWARQFSNPDNTRAHADWTAAEILKQTDGKLDAFVTSTGTGGTLYGMAKTLKAHNPDILVVSVEPASWPVLDALDEYPIIPGISGGILLEIAASGLVDRVVLVGNDEAVSMARRLAREEGMFCGMSSGANLAASLQVARELGPGKRVVTLLPDSRDRYLMQEIYTT